ncbi:MAG TPA: hypothetical protein VE870_06875, partial [Bacteroidales bacterium]|nr:hypothetical protein [Bacteroidales bacterium]
MEFIRANQVDANTLNSNIFDIFIVAAGYEKRCTYLLENYNISAAKKVAIAFDEKSNELHRRKNNRILKDNGFTFIQIAGSERDSLGSYLEEHVFTPGSKNLRILIDYSCMTKLWYSTIINYFVEEEDHYDSVNAFFSYTPAKFSLPKKSKSPKKVESINIGTKRFDPAKPTALVIGLGYEKGRAEYIKRKVKPDLTCLMYADPAPDNQYVECVFKMNQDIMNEIDVRNLYNYPLNEISRI